MDIITLLLVAGCILAAAFLAISWYLGSFKSPKPTPRAPAYLIRVRGPFTIDLEPRWAWIRETLHDEFTFTYSRKEAKVYASPFDIADVRAVLRFWGVESEVVPA